VGVRDSRRTVEMEGEGGGRQGDERVFFENIWRNERVL